MPEHITAEPAEEPVSLDEAKVQMSLETTEDDDFVSGLLAAARKYTESYLNRAIVAQTWEAVLSSFPKSYDPRYRKHTCHMSYAGSLPCQACDLFFELPRGHLAPVTTPVKSVKYIDVNGAEQTLTLDTDYKVDAVNVPGRIHLAFGKSWPTTRYQWDAVKVVYVVGWEDAASVPEPVKQGILLLVSQMYEHRTPEVTGTIISAVKFSYESLLNPYRIFYL